MLQKAHKLNALQLLHLFPRNKETLQYFFKRQLLRHKHTSKMTTTLITELN